MKTSLDFFTAIPSSMTKMVILGEMKELGDSSDKEHKKLLNYLTIKPEIEVCLVGKIFDKIFIPEARFNIFESVEDLINHLKKEPVKGRYIFIKGSNSVHLEKVITHL